MTTTILKTACNRDCPDTCGMLVTVEDGRAVRLQGDPEHPVTKGFLCHRTSRFLETQYDPDRIVTPLVRRGDSLEPASWDEALDLIAHKMLQIREESGGAAILHYRSGGSLGMMKAVTDYFFEQFGPVTIKSGDICTGAGKAAQLTDFGDDDTHDLFDVQFSKTIVLWGKNPYVSNVHLLPLLKEAKRRGAKIVLIDPAHHRTADLCDLYLQPRPGADMGLALGVAQTLLSRDLYDAAAPEYCDHFDEFRELAFSRTLPEWSQSCDVPVSDIERLAEIYANGPSAILLGFGVQRRSCGSTTIRAIDALAAISGNLGIPGGGVSFCAKRRAAFDLSFCRGLQTAPRSIPEPLLGPEILAAKDPPIRMVWVTAGNPVAMLPDSEAVAQALRTREFTVVVDSVLTDTAQCAHVVLPCRTLLEDDDVIGSYGHHWLVESRPAIMPPPEVRSDYEIVQLLAPRVGLGAEFELEVDEWKERLLAPVSSAGASLTDVRQGAVRNPTSKQVIFEGRRFPTQSGRVNLVHGEVVEAPRPPAERPLMMMAASTEQAQSSQWVHGALSELLTATVHPDAAPGFAEGDEAIVESTKGSLRVTLTFDTRQRRDMLLIPKGGWLSRGHCSNSLVPARLTDAGGCAVLYDTPVRLLRPE